MLDLDDMPDTEFEVGQPAGALAGAAEGIGGDANATDTDEPGFEIEGEDHHEGSNDDVELRRRKAAFAKQKHKAREAKAREEQERVKREALERELAELKQQVGQLRVGPKPTYEACGYDDAVYEQKLADWIASGGNKQQQAPTQQHPQSQAGYELDPEIEFEHEEAVAVIKKAGVSDYDDKSAALDAAIAEIGMNPSVVRGQLRQLCSLAGIDSGKAEYMLGRNTAVVAELANAKSQQQVKRILQREADKLKLRQKQKLDVKPGPSISSSGSVGNLDKQIEKARNAWRDAEPHNQASAWQEYQRIKKSKSK
ncbi:hypothetical protein [Aeromonas phage 4_4512]|nr:hypothetical protein [Aeromonas phage 4_4512]